MRPGTAAVQTVLPDVGGGRGGCGDLKPIGSDVGNGTGHCGGGAVNAVQSYGGGSRNGSNRHTGIGAGKPPGRG